MRGTIRKEIKKDGTKTYNYLIYIGTDENGKRKYKRKRGFTSEAECEAALAEMICNLNKGVGPTDDKISVASYLDRWMDIYAKKNVKHTTYARYSTFVKQIKEYIGPIKLAKLSPMMIQKFYNDVQDDRGISNNTVIKLHRMFHEALKQAQKWQLIYTNPADLVTTPKADAINMKFWPPEEISDYLELLKNEPLYPIILLAVHTGMREDEICGLRWEDVDLLNKVIYVRNAVQRKAGEGRLVLDCVKSKNSIRPITLSDTAVQLLKGMKKKDKELKLKTKLEPNFVFHWNDCTTIEDMNTHKMITCYRPIDPHYISEKFPETIDNIKDDDGNNLIPKIRFHDLRHTHATLLRSLGVDIKIISERLGHSDVAFTIKTYTHTNVDMQRNEMKKANEYL